MQVDEGRDKKRQWRNIFEDLKKMEIGLQLAFSRSLVSGVHFLNPYIIFGCVSISKVFYVVFCIACEPNTHHGRYTEAFSSTLKFAIE